MTRRGEYAPLGASDSRLDLGQASSDDGGALHANRPPARERDRNRSKSLEQDGDEDEDALGDINATDMDRGLLSGDLKEIEREGVLLEGKDKSWLAHVRARTVLLSGLAVAAIVLLAALFHPSSPYYYSSSSTSTLGLTGWYSGDAASLPAGVYSPESAVLAKNPLPSGAKFGDIPFAGLGGSKASASAVPEWAGGDGGAKDAEKHLQDTSNLRWNGTHWFEPTVILVSLDGVRPDYLEQGVTPHLSEIGRQGLRADFLQPVWPSLTFPNHYTILTGLYPSSHGIVANDFVDPSTGDEFIYTKPEHSWASKWWHGEPQWSTAVKNGKRSAVLMWPGPPMMQDGTRPTYFYPFHNNYAPSKKVLKIADWLDLPLKTRPNLINAYAPEVDQQGHATGPGSSEVTEMLREMDLFARDVFVMLQQRNLTDIVDVIFVSDHGMTSTANERLVFLDDILGKEGFEGIATNEGWPSAGLRFKDHIDSDLMLAKLVNASSQPNSGFRVFTHDTMPQEWHFSGNPRIAPIYVVPDLGWAISDRHDFHVKMNGQYVPLGNHGYDPAEPDMHAIFVAHGPFVRRLKQQRPSNEAVVIPGFANLEIYDLVMRLIGVPEAKRAPNNGTEGFWDQYLV
ncbi:hypothetical protein OIV83_002252 [Microbotryomycetes sp. JL201]|nr:hypothetical protein OIV83_002252 [Microbotryomycetes sp. JL201]